MKALLLYCCLFLNISILVAQTWIVDLPYETADPQSVLKKLIKTQDGGFLVLIQKYLDAGNGAVNSIHTMFKYDKDGELEWEKDYDFGVTNSSPARNSRPRDIIQLSTGNFFMPGTYTDLDTSFQYVLVTNEQGDSLSLERSVAIRDMNYINDRVFARTRIEDSNYFIELNDIGKIIYELELDESIFKTLINKNEEIFIASGVGLNQLMKKISLGGTLIIEIPPYDNFIDHFSLNELDGFTSYKDDLLKVDNNLNEIWFVPFEEIFPGESDSDYQGTIILHTSDAGYLVGGSVYFDFFPDLVYLIKYDKEGNEEWRGVYPPDYLAIEHIQDVVEVSDGYVLLGGDSFTEKIRLIKLTKEGLLTSTTTELNDELKQNVFIYPNPVREKLHVQFLTIFIGRIRIINALGMIVEEREIESIQNLVHDVAPYPQGYYWIQLLEENNSQYTLPFIKQ